MSNRPYWNPVSLQVGVYFVNLQTISRDKHLLHTENRNPAARKFLILFSIDNYIANIILYALNRSKLNFGVYLTFKNRESCLFFEFNSQFPAICCFIASK